MTKDKIPYQDAHWYRWFEIWSITRSPYHDMISQPYQNTDLINDTTITRSLHDMVTRRSNTHWACHPRPVPVLMCTLWYKRVFLLVHRFASDHQIVKKRRNDHGVTELIIIMVLHTVLTKAPRIWNWGTRQASSYHKLTLAFNCQTKTTFDYRWQRP